MTKEANNNKKEVRIKIAEATGKFAIIQKEIQGIEAEMQKMETVRQEKLVELYRLQGEHRALSELIGDNPGQDPEQTLPINIKDNGNIPSQKR